MEGKERLRFIIFEEAVTAFMRGKSGVLIRPLQGPGVLFQIEYRGENLVVVEPNGLARALSSLTGYEQETVINNLYGGKP